MRAPLAGQSLPMHLKALSVDTGNTSRLKKSGSKPVSRFTASYSLNARFRAAIASSRRRTAAAPRRKEEGGEREGEEEKGIRRLADSDEHWYLLMGNLLVGKVTSLVWTCLNLRCRNPNHQITKTPALASPNPPGIGLVAIGSRSLESSWQLRE